MMRTIFVPVKPDATMCWDISAKTEKTAWKYLAEAASGFVPYKNKNEFIENGYAVRKVEYFEADYFKRGA
jgi:hypothetical protein